MTASLCQRLGGLAMLSAVVDDAVDRHAANPALALLFRGQDLPQVKARGVSFLKDATGAPYPESAALVGESGYVDIKLNPVQMQAVIGDLIEALRELGIGPAEVGEVVSLFTPMNSTGPSR